jgi:hypothetical protein
MQQHKLPVEAAPATAGAWYRQPVLWLGAAILAASLAGCVWMIVLGARHADVPLQDAHPHTLLDMPMHAVRNGERGTGNAKPAQGAEPPEAGGSSGRRP